MKIVIYHTGALGDLLVSLAALYECTKYYPKANFTIMGSKLWKEILLPQLWPNVKEILIIDGKNFNNLELWIADFITNTWIRNSEKLNLNINKLLKNFDISIDFRSESLRFAWRAWLAKVPIRIGQSKHSFVKFFFTHFSIEKKDYFFHERDRYLKILFTINKHKFLDRLLYWQKHGLPHLSNNLENTQKLNLAPNTILINPTASRREKAWPSKNFRELALKLKQKQKNCIIIGAKHETAWLKEVAATEFMIIQPDNIQDLIAIVGQAELLITNTSSMQFIAASTKTPTITIIGSANAHTWGPLGPWSKFVQNKIITAKKIFFWKKKDRDKYLEYLNYSNVSVDLVFEKIFL